MAIRVAPHGRVIAIEPVDRLADRLEVNCRINGLTNVTIERRVLAAEVGQRSLVVPPITDSNQGTASLYREAVQHCEVLQVETTTLDAIVSALGLDRIRLIKMDLEGADFDALFGARETIERFRPVIAFEYHAALWERAGRSFADADRLLAGEFGYRLTPLVSGGEAQSILAVWSDGD
jgi:FkbM family methyltransferase